MSSPFDGMDPFIEIDLLRGGERLPTIEVLPVADYYAFVSRAERRPKAEVYPGRLESPMPCIPIPLSVGDPDASLNLQSVFDITYERAGYDDALRYDRPVEPPLSDQQREFVMKSLNLRRDLTTE